MSVWVFCMLPPCTPKRQAINMNNMYTKPDVFPSLFRPNGDGDNNNKGALIAIMLEV